MHGSPCCYTRSSLADLCLSLRVRLRRTNRHIYNIICGFTMTLNACNVLYPLNLLDMSILSKHLDTATVCTHIQCLISLYDTQINRIIYLTQRNTMKKKLHVITQFRHSFSNILPLFNKFQKALKQVFVDISFIEVLQNICCSCYALFWGGTIGRTLTCVLIVVAVASTIVRYVLTHSHETGVRRNASIRIAVKYNI